MDSEGNPRRIDLRATAVRLASRAKLRGLSSANGSEIFGITAKGEVTRLSPEGDWTFDPPSPARWVFPQSNGSLVVAGDQGNETHLWLIRPTSEDIIETATMSLLADEPRTQVGDRLYFARGSGLVGIRSRDLEPVKSVSLDGPVAAVAPTPSGDRLYIAIRGKASLSVVDRYSESVAATVTLPGPAEQLRMDPLGQHVIAKPASDEDSAWIIDVATNRVSGAIATRWRNDLPAFAPGGSIAVVRGGDVVFVKAADLRDGARIAGGAGDLWYFFAWNGFRPRAADLDRPVTFDTSVATPAGDSLRLEGDSLVPPPLRDTTPSLIVPPPITPPRAGVYMVSFAAVLSEQRARELAAGISVNGVRPRVAAAASGSTTIFRVVLGPYSTREEADRVGRDAGRQYWVYEEKQ